MNAAGPNHSRPATEEGEGQAGFLAQGGRAQLRYETLREYMLRPAPQRPRASPARFDLDRYERFGLLGLLERDPVGGGWFSSDTAAFDIEVITVGAADGDERRARLVAFLAQLITTPQGGEDDSGCPLRPGFYRDAGEGANDPEPARRHHAVC